MNIYLNQWWSNANPFLIADSVYLFYQTIASWPLIFEIPWYIHDLRILRTWSVEFAWLHFLFNAIITADWAYQIFWEHQKEDDEYTFMDVFVNMFMAYNIVFNLHILPVDLNIIGKELWLEMFPPLLGVDENEELTNDDVKNELDPKGSWFSSHLWNAHPKAIDETSKRDVSHL